MQVTDEYLTARVMTASREQLHQMVVDGALRHTMAAEQAMTAEDYAAAHTALNDARNHVLNLLTGLSDGEDEFLVNLRGLMKLAYKQLAMADWQRDVAQIVSAREILEAHRETWQALMAELAESGEEATQVSASI